MTDRYFSIAESKRAAVRTKHTVLEGTVPLPQKTRGRRAKALETGRTAKRPVMDGNGAPFAEPGQPKRRAAS